MTHNQKEEKLAGGNLSDVYRSGDTVRRDLKPTSSKIHNLLLHLENKNYHYAPQFLGIDDKGREILSFLAGEAGNYPLKKYMRSDKSLQTIALMLRQYHEAVADFPFEENWEPLDNTPKPYEIICHNDFAIYNIIFDQHQPVGIIDFDVAAPGPKIWDIAYTLYTCIPLSRFYYTETGEAIYYDSSEHAENIKQRIKLFIETYGEKLEQAHLEAVLLRLKGLCQTITRKAQENDPNFKKMIEEGHLEHYQKDIEFIQKHQHEWI